jgi:predicted DNA-binding transcriptional regulator AlpA
MEKSQLARGFIAMEDRYIRAAELVRKAGLSLSTIWRLEQTGEFPLRRALGPNSVGWLESEVGHWVQTRQATSHRNADGSDKMRGSSQ